MNEKYINFCYDQIGSYTLEYIEYFESLRPELTRAGIDASLPEYISAMLFTSGAVSVASFVLSLSIFIISAGISGIILAFGTGIIFGVLTILGFYLYPSIRISDRSSKIEDQLPFAVLYMSTLAGTGTSRKEIFGNLSRTDEYNELSDEAEKIYRDIDQFGMDVQEALEKGAKRSPSDEWSDVLWGMNHVVTTGGSIREFLKERSSVLMNEYERRIEEFSNQLSLLIEVYIIMVIFGSIIFTSMSVVMTSFSDLDPSVIVMIQLLATFLGLPLISFIFMIIVDGLTPGGIE